MEYDEVRAKLSVLEDRIETQIRTLRSTLDEVLALDAELVRMRQKESD